MFAPTFSSRLGTPSTQVAFLTFNNFFHIFSCNQLNLKLMQVILRNHPSHKQLPNYPICECKFLSNRYKKLIEDIWFVLSFFSGQVIFWFLQVSWHFPSFSWKCVLKYFCFCLFNFDVTKLRKHLHELHRSWSFHLMANLCTRSLSLFSCRISFVNQPFVVH